MLLQVRVPVLSVKMEDIYPKSSFKLDDLNINRIDLPRLKVY